jgi:AcrR family transcriptional regulator
LEILQAAFRAIARLGPADLTLAAVANEAGVSAASLVQRFGSKRALLLAAAADTAGGHVYIFEGLREKHRSPKAALLGLAQCMGVLGKTPEEVAHSLAFLQADLSDPDFRRYSRLRSQGMYEGIRALLREAVKAGEIRNVDSSRLARAVQATLNGSVLEWTVHRKGLLSSWVRRDLQTVLRPYSISRARPLLRPARSELIPNP